MEVEGKGAPQIWVVCLKLNLKNQEFSKNEPPDNVVKKMPTDAQENFKQLLADKPSNVV